MLFNRLHREYAVWFQSSDFAFFITSVRFLTNTLACLTYKAYNAFKAFMAFKRSRLNPVQNYRSVTSFSVDWPRTMRLVYASVSILSVCAIMLWVIVIQTRWNTKRRHLLLLHTEKTHDTKCKDRVCPQSHTITEKAFTPVNSERFGVSDIYNESSDRFQVQGL